MLEDVGKVVDACPDIEMIVRLHPRTRQASAFQQLATQHDRIRLARGGPLWRELQRTACVISCASSAGVEAVRAGVPVIQLLPQGSGDLLSAQDWGFVGTARNAHELASMLRTALAGASEPGPDRIAAVFANLNQPAAPRIVSQLLEEFSTRLLGSSTASPRTPSPSEMDSCRSNSASYERRPAG